MSDNIRNSTSDSNDSKLEETSTQNCHDEISDREIFDVAFDSYIKLDKNDVKNEYTVISVSSPIFTSYRSFPQLEDIQKQYSILASDPHASSEFVKSLLAKNRTKILNFINKVINDFQTPEYRDKIINDVLSCCNYQFQYALDIENKLSKQKETLHELVSKGRARS